MNAVKPLPDSGNPTRADSRLSQIVINRPGAAELFERLGLDYCCGGAQTLTEACGKHGLDPATVNVLLESLADAPEGNLIDQHDVAELSITDLCDHIVSEHHQPLRKRLERTGELVETVIRVHGAEHPELRDLEGVYSGLSSEFLEHADREEALLFPFCRSLDADTGPAEIDPELLGLLEDEHSATGAALARLRDQCNDYDPGEAFCATHRAMMVSLHELELDTHQHVHEENNLLFPMVRSRLEQTPSH